MNRVVVLFIGALIGTLFSLPAQMQKMPPWLNIVIGLVGALGGAAIFSVAGFDTVGGMGFYALAAISAFLLCVGGLFAFTLVRDENRV